MADGNTSTGVFGLVHTIIALFVAYFTLIEPTLWGMAWEVQYPFDYLAAALVIYFTIAGVIEAIVLAIIALVAILLLLAGVVGVGKGLSRWL